MSDLQEYQKQRLSQSSGQKGKPEPSERQNCRVRRATAREQASTVAQTSISGETPLQIHRESLKTSRLPFLPTGAKRSALPKRHTDQRPGSGRPAWTCTNRKAQFSISSEWLPGISKTKPFASDRPNWRQRRAIPFSRTNRRQAHETVREGHCKYTGDPSILQRSPCYQRGKDLRSSEKTDIPTAWKKAYALLLTNVTETTSNFTRKSACLPRGTHAPAAQFNRRLHTITRGTSTVCPCILQAKAHLRRQIFGQYFGDILKERQRLFYMEWWHFWWTFIALNFEFILMNFNELFMNFEMYLMNFEMFIECLWLLCTVLIFAMNFDWFIDWFNDLKDLINFIDLYCIVILLH